MSTYPFSIENGAGERLTVSGRVQGPDGERVVGEALVEPGAGPPMHVHLLQEEAAFTVLQGRIGHQVGPNDPVHVPRMVRAVPCARERLPHGDTRSAALARAGLLTLRREAEEESAQ